MRDHQTSQKRTSSLVLLLCPIPFLLGCLMIATAFWQNDADYVFAQVKTVDATLVDVGPSHPSRGRPRFYPSFRLSDGQILKLENAMVADEIPPANQTVQLRCSLRKPHHCKTPASPNIDPVFYAIAALWIALTLVITVVMWRTLYSRLRTPAS